MAFASVLAEKLAAGVYDERLKEVYVDASRVDGERSRYIAALNEFQKLYGDKEVEVYSAPGRSEVGGNHTDHQLGKVLATSVNIDTVAVVAKRQDKVIAMKSEGYRPLTVDLGSLEPDVNEYGTSVALIRGVAAGLKKRGYQVGGFEGYAVTEVLSGSGLSSSAAYEVLIGNILSGMYNDGASNSIEIAQISQEAENIYFGKPCGLMDQMACSVGGLISIDFKDKENPVVKQVKVDFDAFGYSLCIVDTKGSHADLTDEYAAVPAEMKAVAAYFGKEVLSQVDEADFYAAIPEIRKAAGDRAVLRAIHWYDECRRVDGQVAALEAGNFAEFAKLVNESGESSYKYLQNVYASKKSQNQEVAIGILMSKKLLKDKGIVRVHGGGFAGTIQAFVPNDMVAEYKTGIERIFGEGSCYCLKIRPDGGIKVLA